MKNNPHTDPQPTIADLFVEFSDDPRRYNEILGIAREELYQFRIPSSQWEPGDLVTRIFEKTRGNRKPGDRKKFMGYIRNAIRNELISQCHQNKRRRVSAVESDFDWLEDTNGADPKDPIISRQYLEYYLPRLRALLTPDEQECLEVYLESERSGPGDLTQREAARQLGIPQARVYRFLASIREKAGTLKPAKKSFPLNQKGKDSVR